jgi:hypothetical protein
MTATAPFDLLHRTTMRGCPTPGRHNRIALQAWHPRREPTAARGRDFGLL